MTQYWQWLGKWKACGYTNDTINGPLGILPILMIPMLTILWNVLIIKTTTVLNDTNQ